MLSILEKTELSAEVLRIAHDIEAGKRISVADAMELYDNASLPTLGVLASFVNEAKSGKKVFFNRNFHVEPSNVCVYHCRFCSYRKEKGEGYEMDAPEILEQVMLHADKGATEVHIVGSAHPERGVAFYADILSEIRKAYPTLHIKAFSAVEIANMASISNMSIDDCLKTLKDAGLNSLPGGGAEIFNEEIRKNICPDKINGEEWLSIHRKAHLAGIPTNATMLYGHFEDMSHRLNHIDLLRQLQDETNGFNTFIPLKFLNRNNEMASLEQVSAIEDLKVYAISRIFLDNFPHLKAYWPMLGKQMAQVTLGFGVDDLDGTIDDTTSIYTTAGSVEQKPGMTTAELCRVITDAGKTPVERDSLYNIIRNEF